jgi:hypothetical protein
MPLLRLGAIGGFRWKRLILLGQTGDMGIDPVTNAILWWTLAPQANTYQSENRYVQYLVSKQAKQLLLFSIWKNSRLGVVCYFQH